MNDLEFLAPLFQTLGSAAATFAVMYLWLKSLQDQLKETIAQHASERAERLLERQQMQERLDRLHESRAQEQREAIAALSGIKETIRQAQIGQMPPGFGTTQ